MIKSLSFNQQEIIQNIISLYIPSKQIDLDPTYSKGIFYKNAPFNQPTLKYDLCPQADDVLKADCRQLPLQDQSINSIMFDPPFLATTGSSLNSNQNNNLINKRFGVYPNEPALHQMYRDSLKEFWRILKPDGILIFKCQDKVSSGKQYMTHVYTMNMAEEIGFYTLDLFVLGVESRLVADWQRNQKHARKFHSYFLVFQKPKNKRKMSWETLKETLDKF